MSLNSSMGVVDEIMTPWSNILCIKREGVGFLALLCHDTNEEVRGKPYKNVPQRASHLLSAS